MPVLAEAMCRVYCVKYHVMAPKIAITEAITSSIVSLRRFSIGTWVSNILTSL
jgi:hypothetical protein